jgi:hypothetical protein
LGKSFGSHYEPAQAVVARCCLALLEEMLKLNGAVMLLAAVVAMAQAQGWSWLRRRGPAPLAVPPGAAPDL